MTVVPRLLTFEGRGDKKVTISSAEFSLEDIIIFDNSAHFSFSWGGGGLTTSLRIRKNICFGSSKKILSSRGKSDGVKKLFEINFEILN